MRTARLLTLLAALAALAVLAGSAHSATSAPTGLHGFLLRADEPLQTSFPRTPSFAWNPVPGALSYDFQLSLSDQFRDNSIVWAESNLVSPVDAPPITLPWITGNPHALYARVRAITADGATPWSANFGFDMVPPAAPTPLAGYPGLLRWTPVAGAHGYEVWLIDAKKLEISTTNSLDEREFYTFHQTTAWMGTVRWRIRALRIDTGGAINGLPAVTYGAWSPIYTSTNPAITGGPITLKGTVSDIFSDGSAGSPAHKLTPGYLWTGNQTIDGKTVELYRVYVFTDKQCLNRVYTSAVIGSQAYSPRPLGPLALPTTSDGVAAARASYLPDGPEPPSYTYDDAMDAIQTTESASDATPTTTATASPGATPTAASAPSSAPTTASASTSGGGNSPVAQFLAGTRTGAPIDLWDTNWPSSGYYWTVVGVAATAPPAESTTVGATGAAKDATILPVANGGGFNPGDQITVGSESAVVTAVSGNTLTLSLGLLYGHAAGEAVVRTAGNLFYQDLELPQDVCAAGRVMRFGKASEPSLVSSGDLFATGLSSDGRLTSGLQSSGFYGQPLVSWTPALGAEEYQVQWSKTQYPFTPEADPATGAPGKMTSSTSAVLPVAPGTWWYRVRGFDYSLPTGAQQMSWSDPVKLVVATPKFKIVGGTSASSSSTSTVKATALRYSAGGVSLTLPAGWTKQTVSGALFAAARGTGTTATLAKKAGRGALSLAQWTQALVADAKNKGALGLQSKTVKEPGGTAVYLSYQWTDTKGKKHSMRQYAFDAGASSYFLQLDTTTSASSFAQIAASFRHP